MGSGNKVIFYWRMERNYYFIGMETNYYYIQVATKLGK